MFLPIVYPGVRIERVAPREAIRKAAWAGALREFDVAHGDILKEDRNTLVWRGPMLEPEVVIKRWDVETLGARIKAFCGAGRGHRHWRGSQWLGAHGIPTAGCLALAMEYRRGWPRQWLVMEALPGRTVLAHLAARDLSPRREHAIARAIARQLVALTLAGRYNRDHKPSNLIVLGLDPDAPDPTIAIIDTVAIHKLRPWRRADLYAMFASLVIEPTGCGHPPRRALMMRTLVEHQRELLRRIPNLLPDDPAARRAARHLDWMRIAGIVDAHGDPTPRVSPLPGG